MSLKTILTKAPHDIVVLSALRTPVTRGVKGGLAKMYPEELLYSILKGSVEKSGVDKNLVDDILVGCVLQTLGGQKATWRPEGTGLGSKEGRGFYWCLGSQPCRS